MPLAFEMFGATSDLFLDYFGLHFIDIRGGAPLMSRRDLMLRRLPKTIG
jgi:hypothetical protein